MGFESSWIQVPLGVWSLCLSVFMSAVQCFLCTTVFSGQNIERNFGENAKKSLGKNVKQKDQQESFRE